MADVVVALGFGLALGMILGAAGMWTDMRRVVAAERHRADSLEGTINLLDGQIAMMREAVGRRRGDERGDGGLTGAGDPPWVRELLTRLLDAALPKAAEPATGDGDGPVPTMGEYEPPDEPVRDWTDPFFGLERETVGRLAPGQGIPGIGDQGAPIDDGRVLQGMTSEGWADAPLPGDDDVARWQDRGEEVGEQWLESRER